MHYTVESILMVCITPLRKSPLCVHQQHHTPKSISAVCITPLSQSSQSDTPGVHQTMETIVQHFSGYKNTQYLKISAVCITPPRQSPQCASLRQVNLRSMHHIGKSSSAVCITPWYQTAHCGVREPTIFLPLVAFKGTTGEILLAVISVAEPEPVLFGRSWSRCKGPAPAPP